MSQDTIKLPSTRNGEITPSQLFRNTGEIHLALRLLDEQGEQQWQAKAENERSQNFVKYTINGETKILIGANVKTIEIFFNENSGTLDYRCFFTETNYVELTRQGYNKIAAEIPESTSIINLEDQPKDY